MQLSRSLYLVLALAAGILAVATRAEQAPPAAGYHSLDEATKALADLVAKAATLEIPQPKEIEIHSGIEFAQTPSGPLALDLYRARGRDGVQPTLLFIHGGAWQIGHRKDYRQHALEFAKKGYVCLSMSYRLSSQAVYPAAVEDVRAALRWIAQHHEEYGMDRERLALVGGSAGAHLAMLVAYQDSEKSPAPLPPIRAVIDLYGPSDLTAPVAQSHPAVQAFLGRPFAEARDLYRQASPLAYIDASDPPTLVIHGTFDHVVPVAQSDTLVARLKEAGVEHEYDRLEGWPHMLDLADPAYRRCVWRMERFLAKHLRDRSVARR